MRMVIFLLHDFPLFCCYCPNATYVSASCSLAKALFRKPSACTGTLISTSMKLGVALRLFRRLCPFLLAWWFLCTGRFPPVLGSCSPLSCATRVAVS